MRFLWMFLLVLFATQAQAQLPPSPFDPDTRLSVTTFYVDNSSPFATDVNNTNGTAARPRRSMPLTLSAGSIVEVRGGPYIGTADAVFMGNGTSDSPVVVRCIGTPVIQGPSAGMRLSLLGKFVVWEGCVFDHIALYFGGSNYAFRQNEVRNVPFTAVAVGGSSITLRANQIHHNGDATSSVEKDAHGILVMPCITSPASPSARGVWIEDNNIHHNGGDSIQVGQASSCEPWAQGIFIGGNNLHEDRENAVDVKKSRDVVVAGNTMYGYRLSSSSAGEAVVVHDDAERVWILRNFIAGAVRGIVSTGSATFVVAGNLLHTVGGPDDTSSSAAFNPAAIHIRGTRNSHVVGNTIWNCTRGITYGGSNSDSIVTLDNAVNSVREAIVGDSTQREANATTVTGDFVNVPGMDFHPNGGKLIDVGVPSDVLASYKFLYGIDASFDLYGSPRLSGKSVDIGAVEIIH